MLAMTNLTALFKAAFEHSAICKLVYWPDGKLLYISPAMCRLLGYNAAEIAGLTLADICLPAAAEELAQLKQVLAGPEASRAPAIEKQFINRRGERVWGLQYLTAIWGKQQPMQLRCLIAEVQDIRSRKIYEAARNAERRRLLTVEAMAHLGSWQVKFETGQFWLSDECCRLLGSERQELEPGPLMHLSFIHPQDREEVQRRLNHAFEARLSLLPQPSHQTDWLDAQGDYLAEFRIVRPSGEIRYITAKARPEYSDTGGLIGLAGFIMDITAFRLQEQLLREAHRILAQQNHSLRELAQHLLSHLQEPIREADRLLEANE